MHTARMCEARVTGSKPCSCASSCQLEERTRQESNQFQPTMHESMLKRVVSLRAVQERCQAWQPLAVRPATVREFRQAMYPDPHDPICAGGQERCSGRQCSLVLSTHIVQAVQERCRAWQPSEPKICNHFASERILQHRMHARAQPGNAAWSSQLDTCRRCKSGAEPGSPRSPTQRGYTS